MHRNPCLRANRKLTFGEPDSASCWCGWSLLNKYNDLSPYWSMLEQREKEAMFVCC
jgi:hypothetical protein